MTYKPDSTFVPSLACEPNWAFASSSTYKPESTYVPFSSSSLDNTPSDVDKDDENPRPSTRVPLPTPQLPRWVRSTREVVGNLVSDPTDQC